MLVVVAREQMTSSSIWMWHFLYSIRCFPITSEIQYSLWGTGQQGHPTTQLQSMWLLVHLWPCSEFTSRYHQCIDDVRHSKTRQLTFSHDSNVLWDGCASDSSRHMLRDKWGSVWSLCLYRTLIRGEYKWHEFIFQWKSAVSFASLTFYCHYVQWKHCSNS